MKVRCFGLAAIAASILWTSGASAAPYTSSYSDLDLGKCALVEEESEIGFVQVKCAGQYGYDVYATEGDLRLHLAYRLPWQRLIAEEVVGEPQEMEGSAAVDTEEAVESIIVVAPSEKLEGARSTTNETSLDAVDTKGAGVFVPAGVRPIGQTIPPFNHLGPKLEWRAPFEQGAEPFATIVRYIYQKMADDGSYSDGQVLVVSRFRDGDSCHVAYIDALANANANEMAREVADKYATGGNCPDGAVPVLGRGGDEFRF